MSKKNELYGRRIVPKPLMANASLEEVLQAMTAYNGSRLREACHLFAEKIAKPDVTIGLTISGALTPAGYHLSCIIPLMEAGLVDWIVTTGANLYHDLHYALGHTMYQTQRAQWNDIGLRTEKMIRIYDIVFDEEALFETDIFIQKIIKEGVEFHNDISTADFHYLLGRYIYETTEILSSLPRTILGTAFKLGIPIFTSSPGDSSIGMNLAAMRLFGETEMHLDPLIDVNQTAALVYSAKKHGGKSAVIILGGGSPKNFALQTEPQIQQIFGLEEAGHDYFIQITDARPDTGGLSGATPSEAVTWGKIDPAELPNTVVAYTDSTIALPILTAYVLSKTDRREQKRIYSKLPTMIADLKKDALQKHQS